MWEMKISNKSLSGNPPFKEINRDIQRKWEDNINVDYKETECDNEVRIKVAQERV
jgi:hypothetical protein